MSYFYVFLSNDSKVNFRRVMPLLTLYANSSLESILVTIHMYKSQNIEFEMIIPNMFLHDQYRVQILVLLQSRFKNDAVFQCVCLRLASQLWQSAGVFHGYPAFFIVSSVKQCIKLPMLCSFLENVGGYFLNLAKTLNWVVLGVFHGDLDFLHEKPL